MDKKKSIFWELVRFAITGVACSLLDYLVCQLIILAFSVTNAWSWVVNVVSTMFGFSFGVVLNYFLSTFWVYQNVDKKTNTKTSKFIVSFVALSVGGLLVSIGAMLLCNVVCVNAFSIDIVSISVMDLIKEFGFGFLAQGVFWAYFASFCIKTIVGLLFNYLTRKFILYRAPKKDENSNQD